MHSIDEVDGEIDYQGQPDQTLFQTRLLPAFPPPPQPQHRCPIDATVHRRKKQWF